jgi:hypothetical protein
MKQALLNFGHRIARRLVLGENAPTDSGLEAVYQRVFERELARLGIQDNFFPVGGAANYGLMYVLLRACCEFRPRSVLELGAGQTSLLFDRLKRAKVIEATIVTVEHDPQWAAEVGRQVGHEVESVELKPYRENGLDYAGYDFTKLALDRSVDMLVIDGPPAGYPERRYSRHGSINILDRLDPQGFVVVVDDAERPGEALLCKRIDQHFRASRIEFKRGWITANKRQEIFASGRLTAAAYF